MNVEYQYEIEYELNV